MEEKEKRRYDGDSCGGLLLRSAPSLAPVPPHRLGVRVWAFFVFGCQPAICHSERSDAPLNQSRKSAVGCVYCIHVCVCEHETALVRVHT